MSEIKSAYWWTDSRNINYYILNDDGIVAGFGGQFTREHQRELQNIVDLHNQQIRECSGETSRSVQP